MKLFILRGFETYSYTTHTMFIATSENQAEKLCGELYDLIMNKYLRYIEIQDILINEDTKFREDKRVLLEELRAAEDKSFENRVHDKEKSESWVDIRRKIKAINETHYLTSEEGKRFQKEISETIKLNDKKVDSEGVSLIMSAIGHPAEYEDKKKTVDYWMEKLYIIESDTLSYDTVIDGD